MFGEESIYGIADITIDSKRRIYLPKMCNASIDDDLLVVRENTLLTIIQEKEISNIVTSLQKSIIDAKTEEERAILEKKLMDLLGRIIKKCKVDSFKRITLGKIVEPNESYLGIGGYDRLYLKKR